ncbi:WD repeat-containing protein 11-like [Mytilus californianus]|uniref:WD repeat-containing protein 11-like n=1 Tax=Mytilus californianus TaxID=6549 RepID=UPI0022470351|nr:WD repeat-containing protein 11-like [Mytilus californianus]
MKLSPKTVTGVLHLQNKGACDWGWQGLIAQGCQRYVSIIDPKNVQVIQVLVKHKGTVVKVKWSHENYHHDLGSPYTLRLASGDSNGLIIIWDVKQGEPKTEFSDGNKPIQDLQWLSNQDASYDLLVALHPPYSMILWNADTGTKLWKKSYTETLLSFSFDPFNHRNVAFLGQDSIIFIEDFSITKTPSDNGKKFYICSPSSQASSLKAESLNGSLEKKSMSSKNLAKKMSSILVGEPSKKTTADIESMALNECLQLLHHQSCRHHLILLYPREILILDLEINQTVGIIQMERSGSPYVQVLSLRQRDVLICLHENGSLTARVRRKTNVINTPASEGTGAFDDSPPPMSMDMMYDVRCQSDSMRVTRNSKVCCITCCPVSEKTITLSVTDGRMIFWEILLAQNPSVISTPKGVCTKLDFPVISDIPAPKSVLSSMIGHHSIPIGHGHLKFVMTGLLSGVAPAVTVLRMCPPMTTKNYHIYNPLLALGNNNGIIQILNISSGEIEKEYSVHTTTVRGIEWCSLQSFMSFSYPNPGPTGQVKNEIVFVDVSSGKITHVRPNRDHESPIEILRVSYSRNYFVIGFKDKPTELWDVKTLTMLRETGKSLPIPTAIEWSPSFGGKTSKKKHSHLLALSHTPESDENSSAVTMSQSTTSTIESMESKSSAQREHLVYSDMDGSLYHFIIENNTFVDASKIPPETNIGTIKCIAWKGDNIVFGDQDGQVSVWDLKLKTQRTIHTRRGWIKRIRFAPGRGNTKFGVLYLDGMDIFELKEGKLEMLSSLKSPKEIAKIVDIDWAGSDRPVIATNDGCVIVFDILLKLSHCKIEDLELPDNLFSPHILPSKGALLMKYFLHHQPWSDKYTFKIEAGGLRDDDAKLVEDINRQFSLIDRDLADYLPVCKFGVAERCLLVARLFGDESDVLFWTVAMNYLCKEKISPIKDDNQASSGDRFVPPTPAYKETNDLVVLDNPEEQEKKFQERQLYGCHPLESYFDTICDNSSYKKYQLDRVALHDSKRATYDHTKKCAENYVMLGQTDRAVQLFLETEPDNDIYYTDCLRACLVASIRFSGASQSTIKLVATNLIANGKLTEGVQLLCLINKGLDACRYLQTYSEWDLAVWLAKSTLNYSEFAEVMKRWVDHLCSPHVNQKSKAVLVQLSLGQFSKVLEMLYGMRQFNRAACFAEACTQFGLLDKSDDTVSLVEAVYLEYARLLSNLGYRQAAEHYCQKAGEKGEQFLKEVKILFT